MLDFLLFKFAVTNTLFPSPPRLRAAPAGFTKPVKQSTLYKLPNLKIHIRSRF
jgi:hypothetical protein